MTLSQIFALAIFVVMFVAIVSGKVHRYIPALIGAALTLIIVYLIIMRNLQEAISVLSFHQIVDSRFWLPGSHGFESSGVNWQTIFFIGGMMLLIEGLAAAGFFRWLCCLVAKMVKYKVIPIMITFTILAGFVSMFIDSITVMLFLATATIELARLLKFDPIPIIIAEIFAANTGGAATMCGDPPNIIIGTAFGYSFNDFLANTGLIAWTAMIPTVIFFYIFSRKTLLAGQGKVDASLVCPQPRDAIIDARMFGVYVAIFLFVIILLVTHVTTGLSVATIGVIAAALTLIAATKNAGHVIKKLDWRTLLFFIGLFVAVGGLEDTGILNMLGAYMTRLAGGNVEVVLTILLWSAAVLSAFVDNIPLAATMVPVIKYISTAQGSNLDPMAWTLALGTDIGGNATPIGASANVVGTAIAQKEGYPVGWGRFMKYAVPATVLVLALIWGMILLRY